uniref:Protein kinase domain-containing protein n=1 Tax=Chromera velia CCMP2878 TaxID=1169474 RepID=A0A0G4I354_9ALVE|eukprot:Cvel_10519.t1-p1 / transcript=Cvel_10519.t1 / gene=Cvel_10519 / organism=Chromera_velia_CCMP2878 / gene_product=Calcium-dependent protein kinase 2, putative / transcript_product=Calcium-dependent protein kinase 2, putative / location=Cvel_scaffold636:54479-59222(+) / protein_length=552 / sequence_SO=supercontig / SO=protein_coding / is_pseudo=false
MGCKASKASGKESRKSLMITGGKDAQAFWEEYELGGNLGTGAFGYVKKLRVVRENDEESDLQCVKMLNKAQLGPLLEATKNEAAIQKALSHNHVLKVFDFFDDNEFMYIVIERCHGGTVQSQMQRLQRATSQAVNAFLRDKPHGAASSSPKGDVTPPREKSLPLLTPGSKSSGKPTLPTAVKGAPAAFVAAERLAACVAWQLLSALAHCHDKKLVHRDVKPENLMFADRDRSVTKLLDFGLAAVKKKTQDLEEVAGTPLYCSPEQLKGKYGKPADVWAVGVIVYQCLSACLVDIYGEQDVEEAVSKGSVMWPDNAWNFVSDDATAFCKRLLKFEPDKRLTAKDALKDPWLLQTVATAGTGALLTDPGRKIQKARKGSASEVSACGPLPPTGGDLGSLVGLQGDALGRWKAAKDDATRGLFLLNLLFQKGDALSHVFSEPVNVNLRPVAAGEDTKGTRRSSAMSSNFPDGVDEADIDALDEGIRIQSPPPALVTASDGGAQGDGWGGRSMSKRQLNLQGIRGASMQSDITLSNVPPADIKEAVASWQQQQQAK